MPPARWQVTQLSISIGAISFEYETFAARRARLRELDRAALARRPSASCTGWPASTASSAPVSSALPASRCRPDRDTRSSSPSGRSPALRRRALSCRDSLTRRRSSTSTGMLRPAAFRGDRIAGVLRVDHQELDAAAGVARLGLLQRRQRVAARRRTRSSCVISTTALASDR